MLQQFLMNGSKSAHGTRHDPQMAERVLGAIPLFTNVPRTQIAAVATHARVQQVGRGAIVCRRGELLPGVVAVASGAIKVCLQRGDGEEKVLRFLGAGDSFGEAAALHDRPCPVDAVALTQSVVVLVPPLPLLRLFEMNLQFARNLTRTLADKFINLLGEIETDLQQSALQRLAGYLEKIAEPNGAPNTWVARLPASKTAVAARLGITKETLSRLLRELSNRGLIEVERREIGVRNRSALAQVAR